MMKESIADASIHGETNTLRAIQAMRQAIEDERERCALIAESFKPGFCGDDKDVAQWDFADAMARKIRGHD